MTAMQCDHEGCDRSTEDGYALHRVSPKGEAFVGLCTEHHANPEIVAVWIEQHNLGDSDD